MKLQPVTPPAVEPVSIAEAKAHCRVDGDDEDAWFTTAIAAARALCESIADRAFIEQTFRLSLDSFPVVGCRDGPVIILPRPRLIEVVSVQYVDTDGATQTLDPSQYQVDDQAEPAAILLAPDASWPDTRTGWVNAVRVTFTAGWGDQPEDVPPLATHAIKTLVSHWYENRETSTPGVLSAEMDRAMRQLLHPLWHGRLW